jgi:phosphoglycolate phosphatase
MALLIFDLDGTLVDTTSVVVPAFQAVIRRYAPDRIVSEADIRATFGLPDDEIWRTLLPYASTTERTAAFVEAEKRICQGMYGRSLVFPDVHKVLSELTAQGHTLTVASNCGPAYLQAVLESQGLRRWMTRPLCLGGIRGRSKADILRLHLEHFRDMEPLVMIGDRASDVDAAHAVGILSVGCLYGFGGAHELTGADHRIHRLSELVPLVHSLSGPA